MRSKNSLKLPILIGSMAGIAFSSMVIFFLTFSLAPSVNTQNQFEPIEDVAIPGQKGPGFPIRLNIPAIGVDAPVEYVGLTFDGAMDVPKHQGNVGWFEPGQRPGEPGTAVIAGHYGIKNGGASVFDELYKLRKGDTLHIEDDKGATIPFVVRESRRYDPEADASEVFGSNDGKSHLNLITCEGAWDNAQKSYPYRLVIFADREMENATEVAAVTKNDPKER
jgi:LPXTG-site transpeptidase (sortase) family protein